MMTMFWDAPTDYQPTAAERDLANRWLPSAEHVVAVDRWYPSSKTCSACGAIVETLPLNVREWTCSCGARHDRDVNAARVLQAAGLAVSACGG